MVYKACCTYMMITFPSVLVTTLQIFLLAKNSLIKEPCGQKRLWMLECPFSMKFLSMQF